MKPTCWKTTRYRWWRILLLFCGTSAPTIATAGVLRVVLLADAEVQGDAILLANLLPPSAPRALRDAAGKIVLGSAPQTGTSRRFSQDTIIAAIQDAGMPPTSFVVPPTVTVHHVAHPLTPQDVWPAIQSFLEKHPVVELRSLQPADLSLDASVATTDDIIKIAVIRLTFDAALRRASFRLRLQNVAGAQPVHVTARIPSPSADAPHPWFRQIALSRDVNPPPVNALVMVDPRQSARLRLHSTDSEMLLAVQPLQRGHLGETIRVRLRASGKTLQALVVGENALDAIF
jgi:hypothetical protein